MILVSYDISDDKLRTRFAKYLEKFGHRIQYSVFEIKNSPRILSNVAAGIQNNFAKKFCESDSVYIFELSPSCRITRYGFAKHEEDDMIVI